MCSRISLPGRHGVSATSCQPVKIPTFFVFFLFFLFFFILYLFNLQTKLPHLITPPRTSTLPNSKHSFRFPSILHQSKNKTLIQTLPESKNPSVPISPPPHDIPSRVTSPPFSSITGMSPRFFLLFFFLYFLELVVALLCLCIRSCSYMLCRHWCNIFGCWWIISVGWNPT